ncbi:type VI secretion system Vgr family protein [Sphingomonas sp.]|uniref:type VI secretion system Vgr family protein n=1 Tax=Sphingomonas sp. TaxID=28214 RepID=UPI003CC544FD
MAAVNDTRQVQMSVDLGGEQVHIERARYKDTLGHPFTLQVDIIASLGEIDLLPHLGKPIAVHLHEDDELMRHFHGVIVGGEFRNETGVGFHYRLEARPFTYFLDQNRDMAIFEDKTVPQIIQAVFGAAGISDFRLDLQGSYRTWPYRTQYRESDLTFITRLMEESGIYYYWEHKADKHVMVLCDSPSAHHAGTPGSLEYTTTAGAIHRAGSSQRGGHRHFLESWVESVGTGGEQKVTVRGFTLRKPERPLETSAEGPKQHPHDDREVYDFAVRGFPEAGKQVATLRQSRQVYSGRSQATNLATGKKVTVTHHPAGRLNQDYLITSTEHVLQSEQYHAHQNTLRDDEEDVTHVTISAIPADRPFHLRQRTPRPLVEGLESAIVTGPDGEEIYTDELGRVKIRFHWDRSGRPGERASYWVRVAQFGGLGNIILPRVGQEVMVDFMNGNPDYPIVIGWVFNNAQMPSYPLPDNKTIATWRTKSYPGGKSTKFPDATILDTGSPGANELRFEDKSGKEEVFLHAEKDMNLRSRNDQTNFIGRDQHEEVNHDRSAKVGRDETMEVKRNQKLTIHDGNQTEELEKGNRTVTIDQGNDTLDVKMGNISIKADLGSITIEAAQSITLKCGGSSITLNPIGIEIKATMATVEGQAMLQTKGAIIQQEAQALHIVKGGIVMIN